MYTFIALFRGINVGGRNRLPMLELVAVLEGLGLKGVKTYIQSGNVRFQTKETETARLEGEISQGVQASHGFSPKVLLLTLEEVKLAITSNPFPEGEADPKTLHLYFLTSEPTSPDLAVLESVKRESERFELKGKVFYLHAPEGIGRSKLAARVERALGVPATARNWRTVSKLVELNKPAG